LIPTNRNTQIATNGNNHSIDSTTHEDRLSTCLSQFSPINKLVVTHSGVLGVGNILSLYSLASTFEFNIRIIECNEKNVNNIFLNILIKVEVNNSCN
jgi:hypothetical protein